jgi:hypothetical protein
MAAAKIHAANIFAGTNRGTLPDILIFAANVFSMRLLTGVFMDIFRLASAEDYRSKERIA